MLARPDTAQPSNATNDPVAAIVDFRDQLAARGIQLLVMPVPNKETIYPEKLTSRAVSSEPVIGGDTRALLRELEAARVEVIDLFRDFAQAKTNRDAENLYLAQD